MKYSFLLFALLCVLVLSSPAAAQMRGFVACSTSDSGCFFDYDADLDSFFCDVEIPLLPDGNYPYDVVMRTTASGDEFWVPGAAGDGVVVVTSGGVAHEITVGEYPVSIAFNPSKDLALVSCRDSDRLDLIDTASYTVVGSLPIPDTQLGPGQIVFDPQGDRFFLAAYYDDVLFEIASDGTAIVDQITIGSSLWQISIDPNYGDRLYVTDRGQDELHVLAPETLTLERSVSVGDDPWGLDCDADVVVVTCEDSEEIYLIDTWDWTSTVIQLPSDSEPRDVSIATGLVAVGLPTDLLIYSAYVTGGTVGTKSPVYVVDLYEKVLSYEFSANGSNTNAIAVETQMPIPSPAPDLPDLADLRLTASPNPFNPQTVISWEVVEAGYARVSVYDLTGRRVRLLDERHREPGLQELTWDGRDDQGSGLASGEYLVRLESPGAMTGTKVVLLK